MRGIDPRLLHRAREARVALGVDAVLGVVAALLVLAQAVLLAHVVARAFDGASLAQVAVPLALLAAVVGARALATWGFGFVGRRAAACVLSKLRLDLVESRLTGRPAALDGETSAELATAEEHIIGCPSCAERAEESADYVDTMRRAIIQENFDLGPDLGKDYFVK